jgi:hypothetical protein
MELLANKRLAVVALAAGAVVAAMALGDIAGTIAGVTYTGAS